MCVGALQPRPGVEVVRACVKRALDFGRAQGRLQLTRDRRDDPVADRKEIPELLFVAVRPDMKAGGTVDEARVHAKRLAPDLDASFHKIPHAQSLRDRLGIEHSVLVDHAGLTRRNEQSWNTRHRGRRLLRQAIRQSGPRRGAGT